MRVYAKAYQDIIDLCPALPPETGGVIGGTNDIISAYAFDMSHDQVAPDRYYPDVDSLDRIIRTWADAGISFMGIFHSHFPHGRALSNQDKQYINHIVCSMPKGIDRLYFPLVFPGERMIAYVAVKKDSAVCISKSPITIITD